MTYANVGDFEDPLKQNLALEFCRNQNKDFVILTVSNINHDQIHHIINNWMDHIFFSHGDTHTKGLLVLLHPGLVGVTEADTDPKWRFMSYDRVLCIYASSGHNTREQPARGHFFQGLQNYMENKSEGNEN